MPPSTCLPVRLPQGGDIGRCMVVLITDGRANISLAKSNEDPDALAPDAPKPTQVRPVGVDAWVGCVGVGSGLGVGSPKMLQEFSTRFPCHSCFLTHPFVPVYLSFCLSFFPSFFLQDELKDEVRDMAKRLGAAGMNLLVIDTGGLGGVGWLLRVLPVPAGLLGGCPGPAVPCVQGSAVGLARQQADAVHACVHRLPCRFSQLQLTRRRLPPAENKFVSTGFAEEISKAAGGKYYYLPNASDAAIAAATSSAMADAKSN